MEIVGVGRAWRAMGGQESGPITPVDQWIGQLEGTCNVLDVVVVRKWVLIR